MLTSNPKTLVTWLISERFGEEVMGWPGRWRYCLDVATHPSLIATIRRGAEPDAPTVELTGLLAWQVAHAWPKRPRGGGWAWVGSSTIVAMVCDPRRIRAVRRVVKRIKTRWLNAWARECGIENAARRRIPPVFVPAWLEGWRPPGAEPIPGFGPLDRARESAAGYRGALALLQSDFP